LIWYLVCAERSGDFYEGEALAWQAQKNKKMMEVKTFE
jgi:hypothetical protein